MTFKTLELIANNQLIFNINNEINLFFNQELLSLKNQIEELYRFLNPEELTLKT